MAKGDCLAKNGSGCIDPTATKAITKVDREYQLEKDRLDDLLDVLFYVIEKSDFELGERIVLRNKKSGKIWR